MASFGFIVIAGGAGVGKSQLGRAFSFIDPRYYPIDIGIHIVMPFVVQRVKALEALGKYSETCERLGIDSSLADPRSEQLGRSLLMHKQSMRPLWTEVQGEYRRDDPMVFMKKAIEMARTASEQGHRPMIIGPRPAGDWEALALTDLPSWFLLEVTSSPETLKARLKPEELARLCLPGSAEEAFENCIQEFRRNHRARSMGVANDSPHKWVLAEKVEKELLPMLERELWNAKEA